MIRRAVSGAILAMAACAVPVRAQQAAGQDTARLSGFSEQTTLGGSADLPARLVADDEVKQTLISPILLGPWFEFKGRMNESLGFKFGINYNTLFMGASSSLTGNDNASGGVLEINGDWTLLGRGGPNTGVLGFRLESRHKYTDLAPNQLGAEIGSLWKPDVLWGTFDFAVSQLWWEQRFMSGKGAVRFGKLITPAVIYDNFFLRVPQLTFENETMVFSATAFPSNGLGAVAVIFPTDNLYVQGGIHDANGSPTEAGFDTFFDVREYFVAGEIGWVSSFERRRQDNYHLTVWHTDERSEKGTPSGWGLTIALQRYFNDRIMPFLRYSYSDGGATSMDHLVTGGIGYRVKGHNGFGVGLSWASPSDAALRDQFGIESMYRLYLAQTVSVIPGLQFLINPSLNPDEDVIAVLSLRVRLSI
ncbi:MAG: carbohydrate porin [marine benthic group bacterium]|nr:carbohydrate porin [Gemmatimonadota bacterium]